MSTITIRERQKQTRDVVRSFEAGPSTAVVILESVGRSVTGVLPQAAGVLVRGEFRGDSEEFRTKPLDL